MSVLLRRARCLGGLGFVLLVLSCRGEAGKPARKGMEAPAQVAAVQPETADFRALEQQRDLKGVLSVLSGPLPAAQRASGARALARIGGTEARERLRELLSDDHLDVVRWAAFGLSQDCEPVAAQVHHILSRATTLYTLAPATPARLVTLRALAVALGQCGSGPAERALRSWLAQPGELAEHGAWGLGQLASRHGHLTDETQVALLEAASRGQSELGLFPFTRLTGLSAAVQTRLLDVAGQALTGEPGNLRSFGVRALPQAGPAAVGPLGQVLKNSTFSPQERALAAQGLARLGKPGMQALAEAASELPLPNLDVANEDERAPELSQVTVWFSILKNLRAPLTAKKRLAELAELPVLEEAQPVARRRAIALRCRAAALLAGPNPGDPILRACDPDESIPGALAIVHALDRSPIEGPRLATWQGLVQDPRPLVRQGALRLLASHGEIPGSPQILRQALESDQLGTAVTALQVLAAYPARAASGNQPNEAGDVDRELALALEAFLRREDFSRAIEARANAIDAIGALGVLSMKSLVESFCSSPHDELRQRAARALGLLGDPKRKCDKAPVWAHPTAAPSGPVRLDLETELGSLRVHLHPQGAPAAVRRVTELARGGYYDGMAIHRVVEGFVVQFGDATGDGFGDPKYPPLPCERGPEPFETLDVGMAIAGRDTASTQWFVTLGRYPQLDGAYTRIGRAEGPWHLLTEGDLIRTVRVVEK